MEFYDNLALAMIHRIRMRLTFGGHLIYHQPLKIALHLRKIQCNFHSKMFSNQVVANSTQNVFNKQQNNNSNKHIVLSNFYYLAYVFT